MWIRNKNLNENVEKTKTISVEVEARKGLRNLKKVAVENF